MSSTKLQIALTILFSGHGIHFATAWQAALGLMSVPGILPCIASRNGFIAWQTKKIREPSHSQWMTGSET